jgi:hypothetical protein
METYQLPESSNTSVKTDTSIMKEGSQQTLEIKVLEVDKNIKIFNRFCILFVVSIHLLFVLAIYSEVVILKTSQEFSDSQPTNAILLFILELISLLLLFFIEISIIEKKYADGCTVISCLIICLAMSWVPRVFAYIETFNYIMDNKNRIYNNYDVLKNNLIASTLLHSMCVLFNFITVFLVICYKNKYKIDNNKA